jgi:hypothetical protein
MLRAEEPNPVKENEMEVVDTTRFSFFLPEEP